MRKAVMLGLFFAMIITGGFTVENDGIFTYKVGQFEITMLLEAERDGDVAIIPGAGQELINRYIPAEGFKLSTNIFLIKAPGRNILVDTAFGEAVFDRMKAAGVEPEEVDAVLITHLHGDHIGGLQKDGRALFPKAKVYLSAREHEYFTKTNVNAGAVAALAPYGGNVITFEPSSPGGVLHEILPGISPIASYGHTPGHTVFMLENDGGKFIIAGDFLHIALIQFPVPEISASYDMDRREAAASRRALMEYAAKNKIQIGGMHLVYPGVGNVEAGGSGFRFVPSR